MVTLRINCSKQLAVMSEQVVTDTARMFGEEPLVWHGSFYSQT
jgi:hypothetical protein